MQLLALREARKSPLFQRISKALLLTLTLIISTSSYASGGGGSSTAIVDGKANYFTLEPAFVVNVLDGRNMRFMQLEMDLMSMDSKAIEAIQDHRAPIRHELLMMFAHRHLSDVLGLQQREKLRQQALEKIQMTLSKYADIDSNGKAETEDGKKYKTGIQEVLFTNFVIQ